jgi:hypothetical protein
MFTIESYRDVLSENGQRGHIIGSAWVVAVALGVVVVLFG